MEECLDWMLGRPEYYVSLSAKNQLLEILFRSTSSENGYGHTTQSGGKKRKK